MNSLITHALTAAFVLPFLDRLELGTSPKDALICRAW